MKVTIEIYNNGNRVPIFTGQLIKDPERGEFGLQDAKLVWDIEQAINGSLAIRAHLELVEE